MVLRYMDTEEELDERIFLNELEKQKLKNVWVCTKCGRSGLSKFYEHATSPDRMDYCDGEVVELEKLMKEIDSYFPY